MSNHVPGFQSFPNGWHHIVLTKLATSSIKIRYDGLYVVRIGYTWKIKVKSMCIHTYIHTYIYIYIYIYICMELGTVTEISILLIFVLFSSIM